MIEIIEVNGIQVLKYSSPTIKGIGGFIVDDKTINILCREQTTDEECIKYVYDNFHYMLFSNKTKSIKKQKNTTTPNKKNLKLHNNRQMPLVADAAPYDPMKDPSNPFSPAVPKAEAKKTPTRLSNKELEILVRNHRGYHIHYKFVCNLCRNTHMQGCEYTDDRGHRYVVCNICRGDLLKFKGWIHEIPANIGHGKK